MYKTVGTGDPFALGRTPAGGCAWRPWFAAEVSDDFEDIDLEECVPDEAEFNQPSWCSERAVDLGSPFGYPSSSSIQGTQKLQGVPSSRTPWLEILGLPIAS